MKTLLACALIALAAPAFAHPHDEDDAKKTTEKRWPFFGDTADDTESDAKKRAVVRLKTKTDEGENIEVFKWNGEDLTNAAREMEEAIAESGLLSDMAEMLAEFADDVEVRKGKSGGTALMFDGEEMLRFDLDRDASSEDRLSISGLGRNLTVDRETVRENGKTRTRIVIEMDGGDDVEIDLPGPSD